VADLHLSRYSSMTRAKSCVGTGTRAELKIRLPSRECSLSYLGSKVYAVMSKRILRFMRQSASFYFYGWHTLYQLLAEKVGEEDGVTRGRSLQYTAQV
jgi:hypothetical protein